MIHRAYAHRLPRPIAAPLFGDRARYGLVPDLADPAWQEWERSIEELYLATQHRGVGAVVNRAGYRIMGAIDMGGREVLEVGPGEIDHIRPWRGVPARYAVVDRRPEMLARASAALARHGVAAEAVPAGDGPSLPFADARFDVIVSFYVLEHLHPLDDHLAEMARVLRPGGLVVGAIPAEGGLAWGLGRFLTTRRYFRRHTTIDIDKVICWEHPNLADSVLARLGVRFHRRRLGFWPLIVPAIDLNLVITFVFEKAAAKPLEGGTPVL